MTDEKRMVCGHEVQFAMHVGEREALFLLDPQSTETPYMVGCCEGNSAFGLERLVDVVGGDDYLEAVDEFLHRVQEQVKQVRADREMSDEPQEVLGMDHCLPSYGRHSDLSARVVVLRPEVLRPEYRNAAHQLVLISGGFGAHPNSRGSAVYGDYVFSGENAQYRREHVLGILDPAKAPEWVKPSLEAIRAQQKTKSKGGKEDAR